MATWFIADTHYGHKNIVQGISGWTDLSGCRPFSSQAEHDDYIVNIINARVQRHDVLWHLGDWSFGGKAKVKEFRDRLNCEKIHIVLGNHDHHIPSFVGLFESVQHYKELDSLVLMHYPIHSWHGMETGVRHLHGHVHGHGPFMDGRYDVGVDAISAPIALEVVKALSGPTTQRHATIEGGSRFGTD